MPLTKVHVECGVVVGAGKHSDLFFGIWSETIDVGQSTTKVASFTADDVKGLSREYGTLVFRVRAPTATEIYAAEGDPATVSAAAAVSNSQSNNRAHFAAGDLRDLPTTEGAKLATSAVA